MLEAQSLFYSYSHDEHYAVCDVSFSLDRGQILGFLGPSGAGKSTTQNILIGLLPVQRGKVVIDGQERQGFNPDLQSRIGVSFEQPNVYRRLTGRENLDFFRSLYPGETEDPDKLLEMVGLKEAASQRAGEYSKGMLQRLVFARALLNKPQYLFLDEPTAGLDPRTAQSIKEIIKEQQQQGTTVFLTTHNMFVADELCDRVAFIDHGKIVALDSPRQLKLKYGQHLVRIEYRQDGRLERETLDLTMVEGRERLKQLTDQVEMETIHSQEASLEEIFIKLTGRGLSDG